MVVDFIFSCRGLICIHWMVTLWEMEFLAFNWAAEVQHRASPCSAGARLIDGGTGCLTDRRETHISKDVWRPDCRWPKTAQSSTRKIIVDSRLLLCFAG